KSGLLGLCGISNDLRDIEDAARKGNPDAGMAVEVFVSAVRHYLGAYLLLLNGADAVVFTGGICAKSPTTPSAVCANLDWFGIVLDPGRNEDTKGEMPIHGQQSRVQLWIMPTNEELIVARQAKDLLERT